MAGGELLALRPTAVQRRFGAQSQTLVLSGADQIDAAVEASVSVCAIDVVRLELLSGVLRAAEELDVALQLVVDTAWGESLDEGAASKLAAALVHLADEAHYSGPMVLAVVADGAVTGLPLDAAAGQLIALIEAGFTGFHFPMPSSREELAATRALMGLVHEYALGVEVIDIPVGALVRTLEIFHRAGVLPHCLAEAEGSVARFVTDGALMPVAQARKVLLPSQPFLSIIARHLDVELDEATFAPIDAYAAERIEAVAYAEARRAMRAAELLGGSSSCLASLRWPA